MIIGINDLLLWDQYTSSIKNCKKGSSTTWQLVGENEWRSLEKDGRYTKHFISFNQTSFFLLCLPGVIRSQKIQGVFSRLITIIQSILWGLYKFWRDVRFGVSFTYIKLVFSFIWTSSSKVVFHDPSSKLWLRETMVSVPTWWRYTKVKVHDVELKGCNCIN